MLLLGLAAFLTSIVSGVLGMAGGVALIGVMAALLPPAQVVPVHGMTQLFSNGTRTVLMLRDVVWREALVFFLPCVGGVALGGVIGRGMRFEWLEPTIGVLLLLFVVWRRFMSQRKARPIPLLIYALVGFAVGCVTLFIGATGPLVAPVFRREDWTPRQVVATMAMVQTLGHFLKLPAFIALGFDYVPHLPLLALLLACSIAGTWVGRRALDSLSKDRFALIFDVVLTALAIWLLLSSTRLDSCFQTRQSTDSRVGARSSAG